MFDWKPEYDITMEKASEIAYEEMVKIPRTEESNPLTLEGAIRAVILKSPDFSQYRDHALGIIYTLLGGCIGWKNGRLGDHTLNNYMNLPPEAGGQGCWSRGHGREESLEKICGDFPEIYKSLEEKWIREEKQRVDSIIRTVIDIDKRVQQYSPKPRAWYPISWYGCNLCAPMDAQQDFFDGAIETCMLIIEFKPQPGTEIWRTHFRTKKYAEEILEVLQLRN